MNLRRELARHGFESNTDYGFALDCLFAAQIEHVRCLHVDGSAGRRKTAFAKALGAALGYPHLLYHDFSQPEPPALQLPVALDDGTTGLPEAPMPAFERCITEACAFSESEPTLLIFDQLQAAAFADQLELTDFLRSGEWTSAAGSVVAHPGRLLVALIGDGPLYHSLARLSYRIWTDAERAHLDYRPEDHGLGADAQALFQSLSAAFDALGASPTPGEFERLLADLLQRVHGMEALRQALFGHVEGLQRERLLADATQPALVTALEALHHYRGVDHIEL
ncbi:MAG: hypothetical protein MEQ07_03740 [Aquimonas sp.]|nr:hypothetical protein [Aquimonas sp.]